MSGLSTSQCSDSVVRVKTESMHNIVSLLGTTAEMNEWQLILHSAMIEAQVFMFLWFTLPLRWAYQNAVLVVYLFILHSFRFLDLIN